jgi:hypothetical protein
MLADSIDFGLSRSFVSICWARKISVVDFFCFLPRIHLNCFISFFYHYSYRNWEAKQEKNNNGDCNLKGINSKTRKEQCPLPFIATPEGGREREDSSMLLRVSHNDSPMPPNEQLTNRDREARHKDSTT